MSPPSQCPILRLWHHQSRRPMFTQRLSNPSHPCCFKSVQNALYIYIQVSVKLDNRLSRNILWRQWKWVKRRWPREHRELSDDGLSPGRSRSPGRPESLTVSVGLWTPDKRLLVLTTGDTSYTADIRRHYDIMDSERWSLAPAVKVA